MSFFGQDHALVGPRAKRNRHEQDMQKTIIDFVRYAMTYKDRPLTEWMFHVPNGGKRNGHEAAILKGLGVLPGVNDLVVPIACGGFGGLWIELKADKHATLTHNQIEFHQRLREGGQSVHTCRSLVETVEVIASYLRPSGLFAMRAQP